MTIFIKRKPIKIKTSCQDVRATSSISIACLSHWTKSKWQLFCGCATDNGWEECIPIVRADGCGQKCTCRVNASVNVIVIIYLLVFAVEKTPWQCSRLARRPNRAHHRARGMGKCYYQFIIQFADRCLDYTVCVCVLCWLLSTSDISSCPMWDITAFDWKIIVNAGRTGWFAGRMAGNSDSNGADVQSSSVW